MIFEYRYPIRTINILDNVLKIVFSDNTSLTAQDVAEYCCERRYMNTDDDLKYYLGHHITGLRIENGPTKDDHENVIDEQFLIIETTVGSFTIVNYNSHNGYYAGFDLKIHICNRQNELLSIALV